MNKVPSLLLALSAAGLFAQDTPAPPPRPPGRVEGKAVNTVNGEPVRKASVTLLSRKGAKGTSYIAQTDSNGHFQIDGVEPAEYGINAEHAGFLVRPPGAEGAPLPPVKVERDQAVPEVTIPMMPLGVVTGRVTDEDGDPARGVQVRAMQYGFNSGKRTLRNSSQVTSTDKGEFRLFGLRPGTYYLEATPRQVQTYIRQAGEPVKGPRPPAAYAATFYPNVPDSPHAVPVEVGAGAVLRGIDIRL